MKLFVYLMTALMLVATVDAKNKGNKNRNKQAQKREQQKQKDRDERESKREAIKEVLKAKDKNNDGSLTRDEFIAGESNPEQASKTFDEYNKNNDRYLSKSEIGKMLGQWFVLPFYWRLLDCLFGVVCIIPLVIALRLSQRMERE